MISAVGQETDRQLAEREAWAAYRESLRELDGRAYEEAEHASWERLQRALMEIERPNATV
jgi:hypothetical protein